MRRRLLVLLVVGCFGQSSAEAQQASSAVSGQVDVPPVRQELRRWSVTVETGPTFSGPARGIEDAMRAANLDDTSPGFGSPIEHPFSAQGFAAIGFPKSVVVQYRAKAPWSVGVLFSRTPIGETLGYRDPFQYLFVDYAVTSVAAVLSAGSRSFQIGVGPSLHTAQARQVLGGGGPPQPWSGHSKLGLVAQARAAVPVGSRLFLNLTLEYRFIGRASVGPYTSEGLGDPVTFPSTSVQFNHWFVGVGPGLRF